TRCLRPTLSTRRMTSPSAKGFIAPGARSVPSWLVGADQRVPVGVEQPAVATLGVQLGAGLAARRLDDRRELGRQPGRDPHVAHPLLVVPVELTWLCHLHLEAGTLQRRHPLVDR